MGLEEIYEELVNTMSSPSAMMTYLGVSLFLIPVAFVLIFYNDDPDSSSAPPGPSVFWTKFIGYGILAIYGMVMIGVLMIMSNHYFGLGINAAVLICLAALGVVILNPYWGANDLFGVTTNKQSQKT